MPLARNLHFVRGKRLIRRSTGSFGRGPRSSALQKMLYLLAKQKGIHLTGEGERPHAGVNFLLPEMPQPGSHGRVHDPATQ